MERFNPFLHQGIYTYQQNAVTGRESDLRATFVLNSIFTDLSHTLHRKVTEMNSEHLVLPPLSGDDPFTDFSDKAGTRVIRLDDLNMFVAESYLLSIQNGPHLQLLLPTNDMVYPFSHALLSTARTLYSLADTLLEEDCAVADRRYLAFLKQETFFEMNTLRTMKAGIQSIMQAIGMLTYECPEVYNGNRIELTQDIIVSKVLDTIALCVPFGFIGGSNMRNHYISEAFKNEKPLSLTYELRDYLYIRRSIHKQDKGQPKNRKKGCPAAYNNTPILDHEGQPLIVQKSGIQLIAELFPPYLDYFYRQAKT